MSYSYVARQLFISLLVFLWILPISANEKVLIYTYSYNRPDFIEIQHATLEKYLLDDYEFIVFNDSNKPQMYDQIHQTCSKLGITCIDMPQELHFSRAPSHRNAAIVNYSLKNYGIQHNGIVTLLDSDMFLVKEFSIIEHLSDYLLSGLYQERKSEYYVVDYIWVGIAFLDMARLPNKEKIDFGIEAINGINTDTGGNTHKYLVENRGIPIRYINQRYTQEAFNILHKCKCQGCLSGNYCNDTINNMKIYGEFDDNQIRFIDATGGDNSEFYVDAHFFHYRAGSNWDQQSSQYHSKKTSSFNDYIHAILND